MSAHASPAHDHSSGHASTGDDAHEHQDQGPAALDPDEPNTPYWLTALGGALLLLAVVFFLATSEEDAAAGAPGANAAPALGEQPADEQPSEE